MLERLNDVLAEAERLRDEITRRLEEQRIHAQQHLSLGGGKTNQTKKKRTRAR